MSPCPARPLLVQAYLQSQKQAASIPHHDRMTTSHQQSISLQQHLHFCALYKHVLRAMPLQELHQASTRCAALCHAVSCFVLLCCAGQAAGPAVSYWLAVALLQEDPDLASCLKALLSCGAALAAVMQHSRLSTTGLAMQAAAVFLDALWQRLQFKTPLHTCSTSSSPRSSTSYDSTDDLSTQGSNSGRSSSSTSATEPISSGLALLADSAPAAVLILLPVMLKLDLPLWRVEEYRLKHTLLEAVKACVLICAVAFLRAQPRVLQGLSHAPSGPLAHAVRDSALVHLAVHFVNEAPLGPWQWVAYAVAQAAAAALWAGGSSDSDDHKAKGYKKAPPLLG